MAWFTAGIQTNPATDAILADTGALVGNSGDVTVIVGGSVAAIYTIEHRNSANTANIASQVVATGINVAQEFTLPGITTASGERIRVRLNVGVTGSLQASVFAF
jgi:hypothetical protein